MVMPKLGVKNILFDWPDEARAIAQSIVDKYGEPAEATPSMLVWFNNGPWKKTIVYRDIVRHNFPIPHMDGVQQFICHEVPMEKACELAAFNGSVTMHYTWGEISSCCHDEPSNFLALNLAHEIIRDNMTFEQARKAYVDALLASRQNKPVPFMDGLQFAPEPDQADVDESTPVPE